MVISMPVPMKNYGLVSASDPALRAVSKEVRAFDSYLHSLLAEMERIMESHYAVGIAAPQLGENSRVILVWTISGVHKIVNPRILRKHCYFPWSEWCLNTGRSTTRLKLRPLHVQLEYQNENGEDRSEHDFGLSAAAVQHESDHLNGRLITD